MKYIIITILISCSSLSAAYFEGIPSEVAKGIIEAAETKYSRNYDMQEWYIENQLKAYKKLMEIKKDLKV
jgi:hypothetical protein